MKKIYVLASLALTVNAFAQSNVIPNGNFESWTSSTCDNPQYYPFTTNPQAFQSGVPFNVVKSTDAYHGSFAIQITTTVSATHDTIQGGFFNINPDGGKGQGSGQYPNWHGGFAYNQKPTGIRGYYKSAIASPDTGRIIIMFKHSGVDTTMYFFPLYGTHSTYTPFSFAFNPPLPSTPDTVIFAIMSSDPQNKSIDRNGSMLLIDSVSFTGVSSQPAQLNGDFELWQPQTFTKLDNWYVQGGGNGSSGVAQTTDKVAGNYAVELTTQQGQSRSGAPAASGSGISTGYWVCPPPPAMCIPMGGNSFTNQIDTLCFWYKYAPMGTDSASFNISFKKSGLQIGGAGMNLKASATYTYMEVPFNLGQAPDTAIVGFQSSLWQDSALTYVGSVLKIDEVHFKSHPLTTGISQLGIQNLEFRIYPNPAKDEINLTISEFDNEKTNSLEILNMLGECVHRQIITSSNSQIDVSDLAEGIYNISIISKEGVVNKRLVIVR